MIAVIRISGQVGMPQDREETLQRIRLRRKYSMTLLKDTPENRTILRIVRNDVAYGTLSKEDLILLLEKRGVALQGKKKPDSKSVVEQLDKKSLSELGLKPFFRLHPPRGGIDSKIHFPIKKGVLGNHEDKLGILLRRMI